jgi:predicted alpha/beta-fold hydrolase
MTLENTDTRVIRSAFEPARWLRNRHAQTIYASLPWSWRSRPALRRDSLELPDGDITAVDWLVEALMEFARDRGWRSCVLHFRDCGDYRNRLPRRYHAGETNDLRFFLNQLQAQRETSGNPGPLLAVGYSLGGNVLLKYLGESESDTPLSAAAAISVPLDLHECADALDIGFSRVYQRYLLKRMKSAVTRKFDRHTAAFDWSRAMNARTFAEFDDAVTAPLHGFAGKQDYYDRCSSVHYLKGIQTPTLIVNALDDPFMTQRVIPEPDRLSEYVTLEVAESGGHVGFIDGGPPWRPSFYLPGRILGFLEPYAARPGL